MAKKQNNKIDWPALSTVQFNVVPDSTFNIGSGITTITPNQVSQLWGMPADSYEANRILYPEKTVVNPHMGQNTIIYNPNTNNRDAVSLDALHVMHDSPIYQELYKQYVESLPQGFEPLMEAANDEFGNEGITIIEKYQKGLPLSQEEQEAVEPIYDALLRRQFAPDYMRNVPHGYQDKAILPIIPSINMSGDEAIRRYMESYPLKEVTITPENKHEDGGPLHPDWSELSMKERAAYIRMGVANGYKDIDSIRQVYNEFRNGGNKKYNYTPSDYIKNRISTWEGTAMDRDTIDPLTGKVAKKNASFDTVSRYFINAIPEDIREQVLSNQALADHLYSYAYNVGPQRFAERVVPALQRYYNGNGSIDDITQSMWASGDAKLRGLQLRRNAEREGVRNALSIVPTSIGDNKVVYFTNPFLSVDGNPQGVQIQNTVSPEEILQNVSIPKAINIDDDIQAAVELPEVQVIGHQPKVNPFTILSQIQESSPIPLTLEPYQIPNIQDKFKEIAEEKNSFLQKDLEDRILAEERRRKLGYSYKDDILERDIYENQFRRNMAANGGNLFLIGGPTDPPVKKNRFEDMSVEELQAYGKSVEEYWKKQLEERNNRTPEQIKQMGIEADRKYREDHPNGGDANPELQRASNLVTQALQDQIPFSGNNIQQAAEEQRQQKLDKWGDYKKGINATITLAELGLSGASLLGAYANWKNWANTANVTKQTIANLLQKAQLPMQVGGTLIDGYQTYDALQNNDNQNAIYNGISTGLGVAGSVGASDIFLNSRLHSPKVDRVLDAIGIIQNAGDFVKFGYDTYKGTEESKKNNGGNLFPIGGLMPTINTPVAARTAVKNLWDDTKDRLYRTITPQGYHLGKATKEFIKGNTRDYSKFTPAENEVWAKYLGVPYEGESSFEKAVYAPSQGGATYDDVIKFKDESQILSNDALRQILHYQTETGKNNMLVKGNESGLGTYTLSLGEDENGKYISYYDDWDINPTRGISAKYNIPILNQMGDIVPGTHPFTVYGRRYYSDDDLQRLKELESNTKLLTRKSKHNR